MKLVKKCKLNLGRRMEVKDLWKFKDGAAVYGYCECGREVQYQKDYKCPCCNVKLMWNLKNKIRVV